MPKIENRKKILIGVMAVVIAAALYLYKDDIFKMFTGSDTPVMPALSASKPVKPVDKPVVTEQKAETPKSVKETTQHNDFINIEQVENSVKKLNSMGELSDLRNQMEIYKAKAELTREQVNFETEKKNLLEILNPTPQIPADFIPPQFVQSEPQQNDAKTAELLEMLKKQQEEIDEMQKNQQAVPAIEQTEGKEKVIIPDLPVDEGIVLLSIQKNEKQYTAIIKENGFRKRVKAGDVINGSKIKSIQPKEIIMQSGKKYSF